MFYILVELEGVLQKVLQNCLVENLFYNVKFWIHNIATTSLKEMKSSLYLVIEEIRKKKKNKMFTVEVEPGSSDCHNSMISTWPPQLPVILYGIFDLITQYNCTRSLLGSLFLQNFQKICVN